MDGAAAHRGADRDRLGRWADAALRRLASLVLGIFFRRLEVVGAERVPVAGPLVLVANHVNGLVDGVLLAAAMPRMPRFLGKSTLWDIKPLVPILELAGVIPVHRRHDPGADPSKNLEAFSRSWELLAGGGVLALFPEGVSHSEPSLQPLKTGVARIVLEAERTYGPLGVRIVPVGLIFDAKGKFRSRALVQVGDAVDPAPEVALYTGGGAEPDEETRRWAVRQLTARVDQGLEAVTLNYGSWEEARRVARAADLWARPRPRVPTKEPLAGTFGVRRAFLEGYAELRRTHPERTAAVERSLADYDALLAGARLRDEQVAAAYPPASVLGFLARTLVALLLRLPLAVVGTLLNWVPYRLLGLLAARRSPDLQATWKIFPGLILYPALWLLEAAAAGWAASRWGLAGIGAWIAAGVLVAAPLTGRVALTFHDVRRRLLHEARAFLLLRTRQRLAAELKTRRGDLLRELDAMVELYRRDRKTGE